MPEIDAAVAPGPTDTRFLSGLADVASRYDGFLLDQWGVLHDGRKAYPAARHCLEQLRDLGKAVIILSNSGRFGEENAALLAGMGFPRHLYDEVVSAGDDAREAIANRSDLFYRNLGRRCLLLARESDRHLADNLGLTLVETPAEADFILLMSIDAPRQSVAGWQSLLERAQQLHLPMVCGNPDLQRTTGDGGLQEAPGAVARAYAGMGGHVRYHGKPEAGIYQSCLRRLGLTPARVLAIGDSLEHDVAGAITAGLDSTFICGGIHQQEMVWLGDLSVCEASCTRLFDRLRLSPTYGLPYLAW